jgi:hypothetical protein
MATQSFNLPIPHTLLRLGVNVVQDLVIKGLAGEVTLDHISEVLAKDYSNAKRTARALLRIVREEDLVIFNNRLTELRVDLSVSDSLRLNTSYARGICQILKYDKR